MRVDTFSPRHRRGLRPASASGLLVTRPAVLESRLDALLALQVEPVVDHATVSAIQSPILTLGGDSSSPGTVHTSCRRLRLRLQYSREILRRHASVALLADCVVDALRGPGQRRGLRLGGSRGEGEADVLRVSVPLLSSSSLSSVSSLLLAPGRHSRPHRCAAIAGTRRPSPGGVCAALALCTARLRPARTPRAVARGSLSRAPRLRLASSSLRSLPTHLKHQLRLEAARVSPRAGAALDLGQRRVDLRGPGLAARRVDDVVHENGVDAERLGEREALAEGDLVDRENEA